MTKKGKLVQPAVKWHYKINSNENIWYWHKIGVEQFKNKPKSIKELAIFQKK